MYIYIVGILHKYIETYLDADNWLYPLPPSKLEAFPQVGQAAKIEPFVTKMWVEPGAPPKLNCRFDQSQHVGFFPLSSTLPFLAVHNLYL